MGGKCRCDQNILREVHEGGMEKGGVEKRGPVPGAVTQTLHRRPKCVAIAALCALQLHVGVGGGAAASAGAVTVDVLRSRWSNSLAAAGTVVAYAGLSLPLRRQRVSHRLPRMSSGAPRPPVTVQVRAAEALNAVIAAQEGMSYPDADAIVALGGALVRTSATEPWTRVKEHMVLDADSWLKFFPQPQRFPACGVDWHKRLLHSCDKYVIVDKPPHLPCQGVESNTRETAPKCAAAALGTSPLLLAHRLDSCASGVLVLARTRAAQSLFSTLQARLHDTHNDPDQYSATGVRKEYTALVRTPLPPGLVGQTIAHYMAPEARGPTLLRRGTVQGLQGWKPCRLRLLSCEPVQPAPADVTREGARDGAGKRVGEPRGQDSLNLGGDSARSPGPDAARPDRHPPAQENEKASGWPGTTHVHASHKAPPLFAVRVQLLTGRRHQIRAQLAALGSPIWLDTL